MANKKLYYDKFYTGKGWGTSLKRALSEIGIISTRLDWQPGRRVLDLGCGQGLQTDALRLKGFDAIGIDESQVGIDRARKTYPESFYVCANAADWEPSMSLHASSIDSIYCRCMSWFHYELDGVNRNGIDVPRETARFFTWLPSGGEFILQISTTLSGLDEHHNDSSKKSRGVLNNTLDAYCDLFAKFGETLFLCNWEGNEVDTSRKSSAGIIIAIKKP